MIRVSGELTEALVKLTLAYVGVHGDRRLAIWCFVLGPVANATVVTVGTLLRYPWRPRFAIRSEVVRRAARFCGAVSGGELLYFAYASADYVVIGRFFGRSAVGLYRLAYELVIDVVRMFSLVTTEVAFPTFAALSADRAAVGAHLVRFTRQNLIVLAPFLVFVGIEADDLLQALFGTLPPASATIARILCVVGAARTLGFILPAMLAGVGKASNVLIYNLTAAIVMPTAFAVAAWLAPSDGPIAVAAAWASIYPLVFAGLLVTSLPAAQLEVRTYVGGIVGIVAIAGAAALFGVLARVVLPATLVLRLLGVAAAVLASYGLLLARFERVTPASVIRALRG
jgi:O-antigen/teichoic acid export membrane protein